MTIHNQAYLNDLIHEATFEAVRQSPLFEKCEKNSVMDVKADELAVKVRELIDSWLEEEAANVFPVKGSELRSLSESESERTERNAA